MTESLEQKLPESVKQFYDLIEAGRIIDAERYYNSSITSGRSYEIHKWETGPGGSKYRRENTSIKKALLHIVFNIYYGLFG